MDGQSRQEIKKTSQETTPRDYSLGVFCCLKKKVTMITLASPLVISFLVIWAFCFGLWVRFEQSEYAFGYLFSGLLWIEAKQKPFGRLAWFAARLTIVAPVALFLTAFAYWG